jgi:hypothetical protein
MPALIYFPIDYTAKGKEVPFIFFLHGLGESRGALTKFSAATRIRAAAR